EHGVLVQAGGASSAWAASELAKLGVRVDWLAREVPPGGFAQQLGQYKGNPEVAKAIDQLNRLQKSYDEVMQTSGGRAREHAVTHPETVAQPLDSPRPGATNSEFEGRLQGNFGDNGAARLVPPPEVAGNPEMIAAWREANIRAMGQQQMQETTQSIL